MVYSHITAWQIEGETVEAVTDFIFLGSRITEDGDCSHEIKRHLILGRKSVTSLDSILKSSNVTLPTKIHLVKAMVFPVLNYVFFVVWSVVPPNHLILCHPLFLLPSICVNINLEYN